MTDQTTPRRAPLVPSAPVPGPRQEMAQRQNGPGGGPIARREPSAFFLFPEGVKIGNLAGAMAGVMTEVGTIEKGGINKYYGYKYARMEDLLHAITPLMGKHGLAIFQNEVDIKLEGNRLAVTYEFSLIHKSGEYWPERPRFTGLALARDSKGNLDDKAINKCHTNARKYFLLSLFQVPAGDFDDIDPGMPEQQQSAPAAAPPVPGPPPKATAQAAPKATPQTAPKPPPAPPKDPAVPRRIILGEGGGAEKWTEEYIKSIGTAKSAADLQQWEDLNDGSLQALSDKFQELYQRIGTATERRLAEINAPAQNESAINPDEMPNPRVDPVESMNWVAQKLLEIQTYEAAEAFWNQNVAPREQDFDNVDWGMLLGEWQRTEMRLRPLPEDDPPKDAA